MGVTVSIGVGYGVTVSAGIVSDKENVGLYVTVGAGTFLSTHRIAVGLEFTTTNAKNIMDLNGPASHLV